MEHALLILLAKQEFVKRIVVSVFAPVRNVEMIMAVISE
jgi:hypothetical protein